jgi:hypothetical protein
METLVALALKVAVLLLAIGAVVVGIGVLRRVLPQAHPVQRKLEALTGPGRVFGLARLLILFAAVVLAGVITYVYS